MSEEQTAPPADTQTPAAEPQATVPFVNTDGSFSENWHEALGEDFKQDAETLKRYKSVPDLAKGMMNLKRKLGADPESLVKIPSETSDEAEVNKFYQKLGVPETPDAYEYEIPKETLQVLGIEKPDDVQTDIKAFKEFAHKELKLKPDQFKKAMDYFYQYQTNGVKNFETASEARQKQMFEQGMTELKTKHGEQLPDVLNNINMLTERYDARDFMTKHGLENDPEWVGLWTRIMTDMSETRIKGLTQPSGQSPADIDSKINELRNHPAYMNRAHPEHKAVLEQVQSLYKKKVG